MSHAHLKSYLDGWAQVSNSTPETVSAMITGAHPQVRFTDVNAPSVHEGHDGIRRICELATRLHSGALITYEALLCDGHSWSVRWTMTRAMEDGSTFERRGASAGRLAADGRVIEHTDYWSKAGFSCP
jgi:ketosteroid isomerase-like protein